MSCRIPKCMGSYDFDQIAFYAKKRFIDDCSTMDLMQAAKSEHEMEEIALVSMLHIANDQMLELELTCKNASKCKVMDCRERLRNMITEEMGRDPFLINSPLREVASF